MTQEAKADVTFTLTENETDTAGLYPKRRCRSCDLLVDAGKSNIRILKEALCYNDYRVYERSNHYAFPLRVNPFWHRLTTNCWPFSARFR
ncbi:DUF2605 domain-containing protein [Vibrio chagasii]|nr:DUF2605 domain-containing protein [Vibrio chagasii]